MEIAWDSSFSQALASQRGGEAMDAADGRGPQRFQEFAVAAAKEKAGLVRKKIGDEKADVTCRYDLFK